MAAEREMERMEIDQRWGGQGGHCDQQSEEKRPRWARTEEVRLERKQAMQQLFIQNGLLFFKRLFFENIASVRHVIILASQQHMLWEKVLLQFLGWALLKAHKTTPKCWACSNPRKPIATCCNHSASMAVVWWILRVKVDTGHGRRAKHGKEPTGHEDARPSPPKALHKAVERVQDVGSHSPCSRVQLSNLPEPGLWVTH